MGSESNHKVSSSQIQFIKAQLLNLQTFPFEQEKIKAEASIEGSYLQKRMEGIITLNKKWLYIKIKNIYSSLVELSQPTLKEKAYGIVSDQKIKDFNHILCPSSIHINMHIKDCINILNEETPIINFDKKKFMSSINEILKIGKIYDHRADFNIDYFYLDITSYCKDNYASEVDELSDILKEIHDKLNEKFNLESLLCLSCNKYLSKLGALKAERINTKRRIFILPTNLPQINSFLQTITLDLTQDCFLYKNTITNLRLIGINTLKDVLNHLTEIFYGFNSQYKKLISMALGIGDIDHDSFKENKIGFTNSIVNEGDTFGNYIFERDIKSISEQMKNEKGKGRTLTIEVIDQDNKKHLTHLNLIKYFETESEVYNNGKTMLETLFGKEIERNKVKNIKIKMSGLVNKNNLIKTNKDISAVKELKQMGESNKKSKQFNIFDSFGIECQGMEKSKSNKQIQLFGKNGDSSCDGGSSMDNSLIKNGDSNEQNHQRKKGGFCRGYDNKSKNKKNIKSKNKSKSTLPKQDKKKPQPQANNTFGKLDSFILLK